MLTIENAINDDAIVVHWLPVALTWATHHVVYLFQLLKASLYIMVIHNGN